MTPFLIVLACWSPFAVAGCLALHRARRAATPTPARDDTRRPQYPPPVPAPRCRFEPDTLDSWTVADDLALAWFVEGAR